MWEVTLRQEQIKTYVDGNDTYICFADFWRTLTEEFRKVMKVVEGTTSTTVKIAENWAYSYAATDLATVSAYTYN